jgi:hypothetical protein
MATTKAAAKKTTTTKAALPPNVPATTASDVTPLRIMDVARVLKIRYQKARDLMLRGDLGDTAIDERGKLTVSSSGVEAYRTKASA